MEYYISISLGDLQTMGYLPRYPLCNLPDDEYNMGQRDYARQREPSNLMAIWPNIAKVLNINPNIERLDRVYISDDDEVAWCFII